MSKQNCDMKRLWITLQTYIAFGNVPIIYLFFQLIKYLPEITCVATVTGSDRLIDMQRRWGTFVFR